MKILSMVLVAGLILNGSLAHSQTATPTVVQILTVKAELFKSQLDELRGDQTRMEQYATMLGEAKKMEGFYQVTLNSSETLTKWGMRLAVPAGIVRALSALNKSGRIYQTSRKSLNIGIAIGLGMTIVGVVGKSGSTYYLNVSEGEKLAAEQKIAFAQSQIQVKREALREIGVNDLHANFSESSNTLDLRGLPEGALKVIGGSNLNLNTLDLTK